jgi:predicted metalloendopeptidase
MRGAGAALIALVCLATAACIEPTAAARVRPAPAAATPSHFDAAFRRDFFLAYAHTMCAIGRDHAAEMDDLRDPHAPVRARINGVASNLPAFAEAFACAPATPTAPEERCALW